MKKILLFVSISAMFAGSAFAQTPAPAATTAPAKLAPAKVTPATPAAAPAAAKPAAAAAEQKAGGGDGKVWVNGKVYHCEGTKYYGKTKKGEYLTEADAKAKGAHGDHGKTCAK